MSRKQDDDTSFAEEMARMGVLPMGRGKPGGGKAGKGNGPEVAGKAAPPGRPGQQPLGGMPAGRPAPGARDMPPRPQGPQVQDARDAPDARDAEDRRRKAELEAARAELAAAKAELASERQARAAIEAEREAWEEERARLIEQARGLAAERSALTTRLTAAEQKLAAAEQKLGERTAAERLFAERGLSGADEITAALRGLIEARAGELLSTLELAAGEPLRQLLDQRVALVGEGVEVELEECVIIRVEPPRCEITGGSDIRANFRRFAESCRAAAVTRVTIVGGSPAYRRQLKILEEEAGRELKLNLVSGTQRREQKRADADMRSSDLVVIWAGTELDHSVSRLYSGGPSPIIQAPHRGISRMLDHVAEILKAQRRRPSPKKPAT